MFEIKKIRRVLPCKRGGRLVAVLDICLPQLELKEKELPLKQEKCAKEALLRFNSFYDKIYGVFSSFAADLGSFENSTGQPTRISADFKYSICEGIITVFRQTRIRKYRESVKTYNECDEFDSSYACFIKSSNSENRTRVKNALKNVNNYVQYKGVSFKNPFIPARTHQALP